MCSPNFCFKMDTNQCTKTFVSAIEAKQKSSVELKANHSSLRSTDRSHQLTQEYFTSQFTKQFVDDRQWICTDTTLK